MDWKRANITALHKSGQKSEPNYNRPVSLTSICCKLMGKLARYLKRERLLHDKQYGFYPSDQPLSTLKSVGRVDRSRRKKVDVIYLDFKKTFVTVANIRLINFMEQYGIRGKNLQWIEQFLKSKEQRVIVNQEKSLWSAVITGVPQGSYTRNFSSMQTTRIEFVPRDNNN